MTTWSKKLKFNPSTDLDAVDGDEDEIEQHDSEEEDGGYSDQEDKAIKRRGTVTLSGNRSSWRNCRLIICRADERVCHIFADPHVKSINHIS